ncbi:unnamed protein product [Choristocarpus tenellus]
MEQLLPVMKEKMPWLESGGGFIQQDSTTPHTGKGTVQKLNSAGMEERWNIKLVMQLVQSLDLNINDWGFTSLKSRAWVGALWHC